MIAFDLLHVAPDVAGSAIVGVLVALIGWLLDRRGKRIELIVNGRYDGLLARTKQLEDALRQAGHEPPPDPAVPTVPPAPTPTKT